MPSTRGTLIYLMESFTAFKTVDISCSCTPQVGLSLGSSGKCSLSCLTLMFIGEIQFRVCGHCPCPSPWKIMHPLHIFPIFLNSQRLHWSGISTSFCPHSVAWGQLQNLAPLNDHQNSHSPSSPKSLLVASFRPKKGCSFRHH